VRQRTRLNAGLLLTAAALGAVAWWLSGDDGPHPLTDLDPSEIRDVRVRYPGMRDAPMLHLQRRDDGWHLVAPIERAARDGRMVTVLAILAARPESCYPIDEHPAAEFGLEPPSVVLVAGRVEVAFGDRSADGRRYVRAGERLCLLRDRTRPLLVDGLDALAVRTLLPAGTTLTRIETPEAMAARPTPASEWRLRRGSGDAQRWLHHWQGARATAVIPDPPATDLGTLRVTTSRGETVGWRIARQDDGLLLVPHGAGYGLMIGPQTAAALRRPPAVDSGE